MIPQINKLRMTKILNNNLLHSNEFKENDGVKLFKIKDTTIKIILGDISEQTSEAVVNAANNHLWMGGGVAGALKRKGGEIIEQAAMAKGPVQVGDAVVTKGGKLKTKYVIHAAVMGQDLITDEDKIRMATQTCLKRADELKIESIALPALGTGVGGFSKEKCAQIMMKVILNYINEKGFIKIFNLVLFDQSTFTTFVREFRKLLKSEEN
jgi:O-acetyl-ADP-ribose deacetylase (regulator of RNase III)